MTRRFPSGDQVAAPEFFSDYPLRLPAIHADHIYFIARSRESNLRSVRRDEWEATLSIGGYVNCIRSLPSLRLRHRVWSG